MTGDPRDSDDRLVRRATVASLSTAILLILVKSIAVFETGSVSVLSTLLDSLLDAVASLTTLLAVRHSLTPPDREHRFGHGKAEGLAALGQSVFIASSALFLSLEAVRRFRAPAPIVRSDLGIAVLVFAIVATWLLSRYQRFVVRRTASLAIRADALHYVGDILVNVAVIVSLVLAERVQWPLADPIIALGIAVYLLVNAFQILREALAMLMDRELPDEQRAQITDIVRAHPEVLDLHDLRTRQSGRSPFLQLHLELDGTMTLNEAHRIAEQVEHELLQAFPGAEIIIHQDPEGPDAHDVGLPV